jgi:hypothetical protein
MPFSPDVMRLLLFLCLLGMAVLAAFYLRERRLSPAAYLGWGLLIILLPLLGPFLVIILQPGALRQRTTPRQTPQLD